MSTTRQRQAAPREPGAALFGQTRRRVLGWLFGHSDEAFYLRQVVRHTGAAQGAVQRELGILTDAGLVSRTVQGRQVYFQANRESPVFSELQQLLIKTTGLVDVLRDALNALAARIVVAAVFGSAARAELRRGSDIDLLVIGDVTFGEVVAALASVQRRLGRDVNPTVYPPAEFRAKVRRGHHFLTTVLSEQMLFVIGGPGELDGLGAQRMAGGPQDQPERNSRSPRRGRTRPRG